MFETDRIKKLNSREFNQNGKYVLYWMNLSQREDFNPALEYAIYISNTYKKPLVVYFLFTDCYKFSNMRYYKFIVEGLIETKKACEDRGIKFVVELSNLPYDKIIVEQSKKAFAVVLDKGYLKYQRVVREKIAELSECLVFEVENDVIVPIETVSQHLEPFAMTIRPKIYKLFDKYIKDLEKQNPKIKSTDMDFGFKEEDLHNVLNKMNIDKSVKDVSKFFKGGTKEAYKRLEIFVRQKLFKYKELRSNPVYNYQSDLSPYLHFGQISPVKVVLDVLKNYDRNDENVISFFNELIVWRELARNFCYYNPFYNHYEGIPKWAKSTLEEHLKDKRDYIYSLKDFEEAKTHDKYWNAAQIELLKTGKMHNYMRMYWCKKIIEWTENPQIAFDIACYLNDKYSLDGRDPNGYAGISWCFGTHDRPWKERKIFGKVRYMSENGLKAKFNIDKYVEKVANL